MSHDVFLSYSRKDKDTMQRLRNGLRKAGVSVWTDDNLKIGTRAWTAAIQEAIENARCLVVLLSPHSKNSEWVGREMDYADNYEVPILPVLISEEIKESIPIQVVDYQYANLVGADFEEFVKDLAKFINAPESPPTPAPDLFTKARPPRRTAPPPLRTESYSPLNRRSSLYQDFLRRYPVDPAQEERLRQDRERWRQEEQAAEAKRKKELAQAKAKIERIREELPDAPGLRPWHPLDQLRLLWWLLMDPDKAYIFQYKTPLPARVKAGAWLTSLIAYLPLLILTVTAAVGWLPVEDDLLGLPRLVLPAAVMISWALTGLFATFTDDTDLALVFWGAGVGLILLASLIGGLPFLIAVGVGGVLSYGVFLFIIDLEEMLGIVVCLLGVSILGIAGQMLHAGILEHTLPLANMDLPASLLLLAALCTVGGLWEGVAFSSVFQYMKGESEGTSANSWDSLSENGVTTWLLGLSLAVLICVALAVGLAVAVKTNNNITGWIADRLPDQITTISPDVAFTVIGVDVSFSLADVTHGLVAGWTAALAALLAGGLLLLVGLIPASIGNQTFNTAVEKRQRSPFGPLIAVLYVAACLILLIVPPLSA